MPGRLPYGARPFDQPGGAPAGGLDWLERDADGMRIEAVVRANEHKIEATRSAQQWEEATCPGWGVPYLVRKSDPQSSRTPLSLWLSDRVFVEQPPSTVQTGYMAGWTITV